MGDSNRDQLVKIAQVLGTDNLYKYVKKYHLKLDEEFVKMLGKYIQFYLECLLSPGTSSSSPKTKPSAPKTLWTSSRRCLSTTTPSESSLEKHYSTDTSILSAHDYPVCMCLYVPIPPSLPLNPPNESLAPHYPLL